QSIELANPGTDVLGVVAERGACTAFIRCWESWVAGRKRLLPIVEVIHWTIVFHGATEQRFGHEFGPTVSLAASARPRRMENRVCSWLRTASSRRPACSADAQRLSCNGFTNKDIRRKA